MLEAAEMVSCVVGFCPSCVLLLTHLCHYLAVAFGPLTAFSIRVILFHISPTSPYLHGLIFVANIANIFRIIVQIQECNLFGQLKHCSVFLEYGILISFVLSTTLSVF